MAYTVPWQLMGIWVSGDVGDFTIYTDRFGRKVVFPKSPPKKPASKAQISHRARFKTAQSAWNDLSDSDKARLEEATLKSGIVMTGQNLYISVAMKNDQTALDTVSRQTGISLPTIPYVI